MERIFRGEGLGEDGELTKKSDIKLQILKSWQLLKFKTNKGTRTLKDDFGFISNN